MRIETGSDAWRKPAFETRYQPSWLTARRFVDLGRTESMMCQHSMR